MAKPIQYCKVKIKKKTIAKKKKRKKIKLVNKQTKKTKHLSTLILYPMGFVKFYAS